MSPPRRLADASQFHIWPPLSGSDRGAAWRSAALATAEELEVLHKADAVYIDAAAKVIKEVKGVNPVV
jgi:hypothetical protein